jgi:hypothetical protein
MVFWAGWLAYGEEPAGLLERFLAPMRSNLNRLPDYACTQDIERFTRLNSERPWTKVDTLRLEVALVGDRELYAHSGARRFQEQPLDQMVRYGMTSTGQFGLIARHVFVTSTARFSYRGEIELNGRRAYEYEYDVPPDHSNYRLRVRGSEAVVGFQGAFCFDAETFKLIRLDVQAYDIPLSVAAVEATTTLVYSRMPIGETEFLLPVSATLSITAADGTENLNRTRLTACRQFKAESNIAFEARPAPHEAAESDVELASTTPPAGVTGSTIPRGTLLHITLESNLDPGTAKVGDPIRARIARAVKDGDLELVPQGARVFGRLVRLEKELTPFPLYEIGLEFDAVEAGERKIGLTATMEDAGPASGLIRQAKRLNPTFSKRRTARLDILVREVQRGQGILYWDARRGALGRGLPMKWRVDQGASD